MANDPTVLKGVVYGKTIRLEQEPGLPDGKAVRLEIHRLGPAAGWLDRIRVNPAVLPGQPIIKGTGIPAEEVVRLLNEGRSDEELRRTYPDLTGEALAAVRQYACAPAGLRGSFGAWAENKAELDKYLEGNRERRKLGRREVGECAFSSIPTPARPTSRDRITPTFPA